jgi:hypothetical protein
MTITGRDPLSIDNQNRLIAHYLYWASCLVVFDIGYLTLSDSVKSMGLIGMTLIYSGLISFLLSTRNMFVLMIQFLIMGASCGAIFDANIIVSMTAMQIILFLTMSIIAFYSVNYFTYMKSTIIVTINLSVGMILMMAITKNYLWFLVLMVILFQGFFFAVNGKKIINSNTCLVDTTIQILCKILAINR